MSARTRTTIVLRPCSVCGEQQPPKLWQGPDALDADPRIGIYPLPERPGWTWTESHTLCERHARAEAEVVAMEVAS